jgi:hypothetical protein
MLEIFIGLRHRLHDLAVATLLAHSEYGGRSYLQEIIISSFAVIAIGLAALIFLWHEDAVGSAKVVTGITIAVSLLFAIETVSLHAVDAVFYHPVGSVMIIGWIWAVSASGVVSAALFRN